MRLVGPSTHKTVLDEYLIKSDKKFSFGTFELVMTIPYEQMVSYNADTNDINIDITPNKKDVKLSLNVPVNEVFDTPKMDITKNCVAIDLGQHGIGYAVYNIHRQKLLKSGNISIPAIRNVENRANKYRKTQSDKTHFKSNYNNKMEQVRKNAVGDVRNVINTLMQKYHAFPIFETSVDNLESGGNQLKLVYKSIINYYFYSDIDAHKILRSSYWNWNAKKSVIQTGIEIKKDIIWDSHYNEITDYNSVEPLKLHPATRVSARYTSQICSKCNRCVTSYIQQEYEKNESLYMDSDGRIPLNDGNIIRLYKKQSEPSDKKYRIPLNQPLDEKQYKQDVILRIIKQNMRRGHISKQSKDTTQSRFFCVYEDCQNHQRKDKHGRINGVHADENAAKNIGKRFLKMIKE